MCCIQACTRFRTGAQTRVKLWGEPEARTVLLPLLKTKMNRSNCWRYLETSWEDCSAHRAFSALQECLPACWTLIKTSGDAAQRKQILRVNQAFKSRQNHSALAHRQLGAGQALLQCCCCRRRAPYAPSLAFPAARANSRPRGRNDFRRYHHSSSDDDDL